MPADYCFNIIWEINNLYFKRERGGGKLLKVSIPRLSRFVTFWCVLVRASVRARGCQGNMVN